MAGIFDSKQAQANLIKEMSDAQAMYEEILKEIEFKSKRGVNPVYLNFLRKSITQKNITEIAAKLNKLGFNVKISESSSISLAVKVSF